MESNTSAPFVTHAQLNGQDDSTIVSHASYGPVHRQFIEPFETLEKNAQQAGFDLVIASGYRSFERQLGIWNDKVAGRRSVLDSQGRSLDLTALSSWQQVQAILRWSALPGASRHHWGTDVDIYDRAAVPENYQLQLSREEVADEGPFGPMHQWLDLQIESGLAGGFFRPYPSDIGGIAPERWHISYAPLSAQYQSQLTIDGLLRCLSEQPLALKEVVVANIEEIYQRFIQVPTHFYPAVYQQLLAE